MNLKLSIVAGSSRSGAQSKRVADYFADRAMALFVGIDLYLHDLATSALPAWDESMWSDEPSELKTAWAPVSNELDTSDALIVVVPEWHGMVPPALKNFLLLCKNELANKPGLIVAISASAGGSYPVVELRASAYKNNRICWIPDHLIIRSVKSALVDDTPKNGGEGSDIAERCDYSLRILVEYAKALHAVRASGVCEANKYPFGM